MESSPFEAGDLASAYRLVRKKTESLCEPLAIEDYGAQPIVEVSPPKWHLAHTTWFFETFILKPYLASYRPFNQSYEYLFNSYYNSIGDQFPRDKRGDLTRPLVKEIYEYRRYVDLQIDSLLENLDSLELTSRLVLGLNHEQQHQELIVTDLKYILGTNPIRESYIDSATKNVPASDVVAPLAFIPIEGGLTEIGVNPATASFYFDNETPRHKTFLSSFGIANRLVTNGEYLEFVEDGGYENPSLWLSDGWREKIEKGWIAPEYWSLKDRTWIEYTLGGEDVLNPNSPVTHVSLYEADAYARWANARLLTEFEWEFAANLTGQSECARSCSNDLHPMPASLSPELQQMYGVCWEWTSSNYGPYPGYKPLSGALGEYNGKFMSNQSVLRGGSCATPAGHIRSTYRNFFYARDRWQFTGIRLAQDAD